jgi:predicted transcriptional regulator
MWEITRQHIVKVMREQGVSNGCLATKIGVSTSSVQRWLADPREKKNGLPTSAVTDAELEDQVGPAIEHVRRIAKVLNIEQSLFADIGKSEMAAAEKVGYAGTDALLLKFETWKADHSHHCEMVIAHQKELHLREIAIKNVEISKRDDAIEQLRKNTEWLKEQTRRLRISLISFVVLCIALVLFILVLLMVNLPQLGSAGSILHQ